MGSFGQERLFGGCDTLKGEGGQVFIKAEIMPKFKDSITLQEFFIKLFLSKSREVDGMGYMTVVMVVGTSGISCCHQITNKSNIPIDFDKLKAVLDRKLHWEPAMQNNRPVPCTEAIYISFNGDVIKVRP